MSNYVIAVLADRTQAETAASTLKEEGIPAQNISLIGKGYKNFDEFDFLDPRQSSRKRARFMAFWLVPFGFIGGVAFNLSTRYQLVPEVGVLGNELIGGLLGAIAGAMGSIFVGGGVGLASSGEETVPYRSYLQAGKYIVVVKGAANLTNKAASQLRQLKPESIQGYIDPTTS